MDESQLPLPPRATSDPTLPAPPRFGPAAAAAPTEPPAASFAVPAAPAVAPVASWVPNPEPRAAIPPHVATPDSASALAFPTPVGPPVVPASDPTAGWAAATREYPAAGTAVGAPSSDSANTLAFPAPQGPPAVSAPDPTASWDAATREYPAAAEWQQGPDGRWYPAAPMTPTQGLGQAAGPSYAGPNAYGASGYDAAYQGPAYQGAYAPAGQGAYADASTAYPNGPASYPTGIYPPQGPATPAAKKRSRPLVSVLLVMLVLALAGGGFLAAASWPTTRSTTVALPTVKASQPATVPTTQATPASPAATAGTASLTAPSKGVALITSTLTDGLGLGTGMVLTADGFVLTNYHVIAGSSKVSVTIADSGKTYTATVVGDDPTKDVALLKLDASGLDTVTIDQDSVKIGDAVIALGNASGGNKLVSAPGKVTGLNKPIEVSSDSPWGASESLAGLVQTNASAVPGDSGGPMFDSEGEVLGMTTAGSTAQHTTYAIPIASALSIVDQIKSGDESGTVQIGPSGYLGVNSNNQFAARSNGIVVAAVVTGGPAAKVGVKAGDVLTSFNGTQLTASTNVAALIRQTEPGQKVAIGWTDSNGKSRTATVTMGTSPLN